MSVGDEHRGSVVFCTLSIVIFAPKKKKARAKKVKSRKNRQQIVFILPQKLVFFPVLSFEISIVKTFLDFEDAASLFLF